MVPPKIDRDILQIWEGLAVIFLCLSSLWTGRAVILGSTLRSLSPCQKEEASSQCLLLQGTPPPLHPIPLMLAPGNHGLDALSVFRGLEVQIDA